MSNSHKDLAKLQGTDTYPINLKGHSTIRQSLDPNGVWMHLYS